MTNRKALATLAILAVPLLVVLIFPEINQTWSCRHYPPVETIVARTRKSQFRVADVIFNISYSEPLDIEYVEGETGNTICWNLTSNVRIKYEVLLWAFGAINSTEIAYGFLFSGEIIVNVDGLAPGKYTVALLLSAVTKQSSFMGSDSVVVTVLEKELTSIQATKTQTTEYQFRILDFTIFLVSFVIVILTLLFVIGKFTTR